MEAYKSVYKECMFTYRGVKDEVFEKTLNPLAREGWELIEVNTSDNTLYLKKTENKFYEYKLLRIPDLATYKFSFLYGKKPKKNIFEDTLNPLAEEGWELIKFDKFSGLLFLRRDFIR